MMKTFSFIIISLLCLTGCGDNTSKKNQYTNDFETSGIWSNDQRIRKGVGKSGIFCTFTDSVAEFGATFQLKVREAAIAKLKMINVSAWVMTNDLANKSVLVVSVETPEKNVVWRAVGSATVINKADEWAQLKYSVMVPENADPDAMIKIYPWNNEKSKGSVYWDDISIELQ